MFIWNIWLLSDLIIMNTLLKYKGCSKIFQTFFVWALSLIVHTWNYSHLRNNLLRLQCPCCTVPITSGRLHRSPLVNDLCHSLFHLLNCLITTASKFFLELRSPKVIGSKVWTIGRLTNCVDAHLGQIVCDKDGVVDWCIVLLEMPLTRFEESLPELP